MSVLTHAALSRTDRQMGRVLQRMSSGERLQRTAEDPAAMVVANNVRYYRTGVDRVQTNADEAIALLQTADAGMDQITQTLQKLRMLAISGLSTATTDAKQNTALQAELEAGIRAITTMADGTAFGSSSLLNGSLRDVTLSSQALEHYTKLASDYTKLPGGMTDGATITINPPSGSLSKSSTTQNFGAGTPGSTVAIGAPETMVLTGPKGTATINLQAGASIDVVVAAINANAQLTGVVAAYDEVTGDLIAESGSYGNAALAVSSTTLLTAGVAAATDQTIDITYLDGAGITQTVTLTQDATSPGGLTFTNLVGGPAPASLLDPSVYPCSTPRPA
jgi:flagellin